MKNLKYKAIVFVITFSLITACNSDEVICNTGIHNTTTNATSTCDNGLLIMRNQGSSGAFTNFLLDSISKPVNTPIVFNNIKTDLQQDFFTLNSKPSNYDAFNKNNNTYFIEFPVEQRIYKYDINTQTRQEFIVAGFYSAPVFSDGNLYTVTIDNFGVANNPANFTIDLLDQTDTSLTTLTSGSFLLNSSFDWQNMSSTTGINNTIYFLSGTNLLSYNTNTNNVIHTELVPTFDSVNNFQKLYGLEYRNNNNLLAIRTRSGVNGTGLELVEINTNSLTNTPTVLFDFSANNMVLNSEFYSTTYDKCDDTYYITTLDPMVANASSFIEINLSNNTVKSEGFSYYLMGIQSKNQ